MLKNLHIINLLAEQSTALLRLPSGARSGEMAKPERKIEKTGARAEPKICFTALFFAPISLGRQQVLGWGGGLQECSEDFLMGRLGICKHNLVSEGGNKIKNFYHRRVGLGVIALAEGRGVILTEKQLYNAIRRCALKFCFTFCLKIF